MSEFKSNAQWPLHAYKGEYGDGISTDTHNSEKAAESVCRALEENGMGGERQIFPIKTWVGEPR